MDEARLEQLGVTPLNGELAKIAAVKDKSELPALLAELGKIGVNVPFDYGIHQDNKDSTKYVADIGQGGLGMPDRDYYLKADDAKLAAVKAKYQTHVENVLSMSGDKNAAAHAKAIVDFETEIAKVQWTKVELRDPIKAYNKFNLAELNTVAPGFDWKTWLDTTGLSGKSTYVIVGQPTYLKSFMQVANNTSIDTWKAYLSMHLVDSYGSYLNKAFVDERFDFYGKTLSGVKEMEPRWKRGVGAVERSQGESLGKLYVAEYFPADRKARMEALVKNLLAAYKQSIDKLDWMSPETKKEAQAKLAKFTPKIGYPNKWKDYSALTVSRDDLVGNVMRSRIVESDREINKLGRPIDRDEWGMTPQTINAYYNPEMNEIVFPAAILQPPFFDAKADDAVNYGGIGAVIGHEISHGFDDQGAQYDGNGNLRRLVDAARPQELRRQDARPGRAVQRVRTSAGLPRERRADPRGKHRRQLGPGHRLQGVSHLAERQEGAGGRRLERRPAPLHGLGAGVAFEDARSAADRADQDRPALAGPVPRQRHAQEPAGLL